MTSLADWRAKRLMPTARRLAVARRFSYEDPADLESDAMLGLAVALRDYRPGRGATLHTFAWLCINRAIVDGRRVRSGRSGEKLALRPERSDVSQSDFTWPLVAELLATLSERQQVVVLMLMCGFTERATGAAVGVSGPRISQLKHELRGVFT